MNLSTFQVWLAATLSLASALREHECSRVCTASNEISRICRYKFVVSSAGQENSGRVINGSSPGPPIEVCLGDTIVVVVENKLSSEELSLHWHGLSHKGAPHMDGVPMVSQCPILPHTSFRYEMKPDAPGTYFYRAHHVGQQGDGIYGSLTVRSPEEVEPRREKVILVSARPSTPLSRLIHLEDRRPTPRDLLLNGQSQDLVIDVQSGKKHLFRIVNANVFNCPVSFFVDRHSLVAVAADARPLDPPLTFDRVIILPGERFDLELEANRPPGSYVVGVEGLRECRGLLQEALLSYVDEENRKSRENRVKVGRELFLSNSKGEIPVKDCQDGPFGTLRTLCSLDLKGKPKEHEETTFDREESEKIKKFYVPFDVNSYEDVRDDMTDYTFNIYGFSYYPSFLSTRPNATRIAQINNVSFEYPSSPILSQPELVEDDTICSTEERSERCDQDETFFCQCTQILRLPARRTVEVVLIDQGFGGNVSQTFHVHGYHVGIADAEQFDHPITRSFVEERIARRGEVYKNLVEKDTFVVPNKGYVRLRIRTHNIGYWLWEARSTGVGGDQPVMQFLMLVGNRENMPTVPIDFPRCGSHKGPASIFEDTD